MDLVIEDARVRSGDETVWIGIEDGLIETIEPDSPPDEGLEQIDAAGGLVTPSFANPHLHLDQVLTWTEAPNVSGTFGEAFEANKRVKEGYTVDEISSRLGPALDEALIRGNTHIRGFADVDGFAGLTGLEGVIDLQTEYAGKMDIETCAFAQEGLGPETHPEGEDLLREAMELGADVVGGIPWIEYTQDDVEAHVDTVFSIAQEYDAPIHFLVDDTDSPTSRALEYVAIKTIREGYEGRVACSHARAIATYDDYHAERVIDLISRANLHILSNMHIVLFLAAHRAKQPIPRGITRVQELLEAGVNVCIGQDDANDMWYPFGTNDMLELGWLACHAAQLSSMEEIETAYDMITTNAAEAMGRDNHQLAQGTPADLVILDESSVLEAFRRRATRKFVVKDGRVVVRGDPSTSTID